MKKKVLAILFAVVMLATFTIPAMATADKIEWTDGFGFHCNAAKGNGKVTTGFENAKVTLERVGNTTTWNLDTDDIVCSCGRIDWVTFSNNNGKINGKNIQANHSDTPRYPCDCDLECKLDCEEEKCVLECGETCECECNCLPDEPADCECGEDCQGNCACGGDCDCDDDDDNDNQGNSKACEDCEGNNFGFLCDGSGCAGNGTGAPGGDQGKSGNGQGGNGQGGNGQGGNGGGNQQ